ncbi:MAG: hypothetical protein Q4E59_04330 [Bacteroidales bacterium]|nr:hypothetical protein [Bacteroidales bacterium]
MGRVVALFLAGLSWGMEAEGQVIVDNELDRADILIGEQVKLSTRVTVGSKQTVKFPNYNQADTLITGVEVVRTGDIDTVQLNDGQRMQLERDYYITSFDSALYSLPPMEVEVDGKTYQARQTLGLKVGSVPVDTVHVDQFEPPFAVVDAPFVWRGHLLGKTIVLWLLAIVIFAIAIRLSSRKPVRRKVVIKPPTPPCKKATIKMERLRPLIEQATSDMENKQFFIQLTDILRLYLKERYGFNAQESTTQEIIDGLEAQLDPTAQRQLQEVFSTADFVKFAKHTTNDMERRRCFDTAADFLQSTRDEVMEQPQPIVNIVTFSDARQHKIRVVLWCLLGVAFIGCAFWFVWMVIEIWKTFL